MRLLIVGTLEGHITAAGKIALDRGAKVAHADDIVTALSLLRAGRGADLLMIEEGLVVLWDCTLAMALISSAGPPAKPMRQPVMQ